MISVIKILVDVLQNLHYREMSMMHLQCLIMKLDDIQMPFPEIDPEQIQERREKNPIFLPQKFEIYSFFLMEKCFKFTIPHVHTF